MTGKILAMIDEEIAKLARARAILCGPSEPPNGEVILSGWSRDESTPKKPAPKAQAPKLKGLTPEGRQRIRDAVKRRWAAERAQPK